MQDPDTFVREAGVKALQAIGPGARQAVPYLIKQLDGDTIYYWYITSALIAITGQDLGKDRAAWQAWWDQQK
jgi:hypothetical protein